ncbi:DUF4158 domain-containing protein [Streptomyces axinellae]|uniref:DUF4158 domain-containing protein n=1 Tax=Streptomyces axinellae TaxID=552788 RepID=UPI003CD05A33
MKRHRKEIRAAYGFRANTEEDQERLAQWLTAELCPVELSRERLSPAVVARCRNGLIEPPTPRRVGRLVGRAVKEFEARVRLVPELAKALNVPTPPCASPAGSGPSCPAGQRRRPRLDRPAAPRRTARLPRRGRCHPGLLGEDLHPRHHPARVVQGGHSRR